MLVAKWALTIRWGHGTVDWVFVSTASAPLTWTSIADGRLIRSDWENLICTNFLLVSKVEFSLIYVCVHSLCACVRVCAHVPFCTHSYFSNSKRCLAAMRNGGSFGVGEILEVKWSRDSFTSESLFCLQTEDVNSCPVTSVKCLWSCLSS